MLPNSITLTDPAVTLTKRSEQGGVSTFTGSYAGAGGALRELILEVKHTRPVDPTAKGSSLVKLTFHRYNGDGSLQKTMKDWRVAEGPLFNADDHKYNDNILEQVMNDPTFVDEFFGGSY